MSAAPRNAELGYAGLRMSAAEYLALGETPERYELIDGVVVMWPSPTPRHQQVKQRLLLLVTGSGTKAEVFLDTDVLFGPALVYCPDVSVYRAGRLAPLPDRLTIPPDLIVEVLSPGNRALDLVTKRADYERFGVGEYWVLDPQTLILRRFTREAGRFAESTPSGGVVACDSVPGLKIDLASLRP